MFHPIQFDVICRAYDSLRLNQSTLYGQATLVPPDFLDLKVEGEPTSRKKTAFDPELPLVT